MQSAEAAQEQIITDFALLSDWSDRYAYIMELGQQLPTFPDQYRQPEYLVQGCQSQVWFHASVQNQKLHFDAISDSMIVSGLIALLMKVYNDRSADEILKTEPRFIEAIGLAQHLSPNRRNGLFAMLKRIRELAARECG